MNDALAPRAVEEFHGLFVCGRCLGAGGRADFLECCPEGAPVGAVLSRPSAGLSHAFGGGLDTGHVDLCSGKVRSGKTPEQEREKIDRTRCKVKLEAVLTLTLRPV
jgi:hypothetical protein